MNITSILSDERVSEITTAKVIGIDIGSRTAKGVLLSDGQIFTTLTATGLFMQETAEKVFSKLLKLSGLQRSDIDYIVGTGYGRISLETENTPHQVMTQISCHAMGAHYLNAKARTIVDIGGQDSKAIKVDTSNGKVVEFIMNDKRAAGTGRFLEKVALLLDLKLDELGEEAIKSQKPSVISSQCVVFAESEVISLKARGEKREDIAAGIHFASARRVRNLLNRIGIEPPIIFSGGVSNNTGMKFALEELLNAKITDTKLDTTYAGALGAAVFAHKYANAELNTVSV